MALLALGKQNLLIMSDEAYLPESLTSRCFYDCLAF